MKTVKIALRIFAGIAILLTILPFIPVDTWSVRIFDFPHLQLTLLTLLALVTYFLKFELNSRWDWAFVSLLLGCFIFQAQKIYPFTRMAKCEVRNATSGISQPFSIYAANVLQENTETQSLITEVIDLNADLLVFTETDARWTRSLTETLDKIYSFKVEVPQDNTYGMLLFSKFPLENPEIRYLVEDTIPSIHSRLLLPFGDTIQIYAIHPAPPTPQHNPSSVDRDAEMMKIAMLARESNHPVIVLGDFNDVAWSQTTSLFQKVSGLLDLRKGRGLYSTYNAKNWIMRWPLDHVFSSAAFRLSEIKLGKNFGSDHFPFYAKLNYEPGIAAEQRLPPPSQEELQQAGEQIENEHEQKSGE